jgi:hypothetical protein
MDPMGMFTAMWKSHMVSTPSENDLNISGGVPHLFVCLPEDLVVL